MHYSTIIKTVKRTKKSVQDKLPFYIFGGAIVALSVIHLIGLTEVINPQPALGAATDVTPTTMQSKTVATGHIPMHITIKKVNIDLPVVSVPLVNGTWQVNDGVANYAEGTATVASSSGNVGIFGHDRENAFTRLKQLVVGDQIEIKTRDNYIALYTIASKYDTMPSDVEEFYPTQQPTLTLVTCNGAFSEQRFIIKAKLVSLKKMTSYEEYAF